ncbi:alginate lyase family protein [Pedobacter sp. SD-b]|uniref:Alginate lyase family protein n=1 Tax=Pedobacter segetis TaxID=2793069 RepID=A0ABS1BGE3_9SPHI|nr:alginate lyase family protein [Pedobacter segetis]MBK0381938.1 alginate lyase family protein [Pedobacter segetis]
MRLIIIIIILTSFSFHQLQAKESVNLYLKDTVVNNTEKLKIIKAAENALTIHSFSVMNKTGIAASGNKHDYYSLAPYFWPNPKTKDGLPYIRKDGQVNPEARTNATDFQEWENFIQAVSSLRKGYEITKEKKYALKQKDLIATWFLNDETRMNPNLDYAQGIKGVNTGRQFGIIEFGGIEEVMKDVILLKKEEIIDDKFKSDFDKWLGEYADWLQNSDFGKLEASATNNHGTTFDIQLANLLIYINNLDKLRQLLEEVKTKRIAQQIDADGKQPEELTRTKAYSYSLLNLNALTQLALLGKKYGVDIWNYQSPQGGSMRKAYDFLIPYLDKDWPYQQIVPIADSRKKLLKMLDTVGKEFNQLDYLKIVKKHSKQ